MSVWRLIGGAFHIYMYMYTIYTLYVCLLSDAVCGFHSENIAQGAKLKFGLGGEMYIV